MERPFFLNEMNTERIEEQINNITIKDLDDFNSYREFLLTKLKENDVFLKFMSFITKELFEVDCTNGFDFMSTGQDVVKYEDLEYIVKKAMKIFPNVNLKLEQLIEAYLIESQLAGLFEVNDLNHHSDIINKKFEFVNKGEYDKFSEKYYEYLYIRLAFMESGVIQLSPIGIQIKAINYIDGVSYNAKKNSQDAINHVNNFNNNIISVMALMITAFSIIGYNVFGMANFMNWRNLIILNVSVMFSLSFLFLLIDKLVNKSEKSIEHIVIIAGVILILLSCIEVYFR